MTKLKEKVLSRDREGIEVSNCIDTLEGISFVCLGCNKQQKIDRLHGYKNKTGLKSHKNKKYWVYYKCPCGFRTSWLKLLEAI